MAGWSDVANNLILLAGKKPLLTLLLIVAALIGIGAWVGHRPQNSKKGAVSVRTTGNHNQTAGTNNGTMVQENR